MIEHYDLRGVKGRTGTVTVENRKLETLSIQNDMGGHSNLPDGQYRVRVVKGWFDYESGKHYICELLEEKDIETARKVGTTGHPPEKARKDAKPFDPKTVYVSQFNFKMDPRPRKQKTEKASKAPKAPKAPKIAKASEQAPGTLVETPPPPRTTAVVETIEIDEKDPRTNEEMERDEHLKEKYSLRGVKTFRGMDGEGLNATLLRNGKAVCDLLDEGCGGEMRFHWFDQKHGASNESGFFSEFIEAKKSLLSNVKNEEYGLSEQDYFDGAAFVWQMVDEIQNDRRFKRMCKTKTLFQVDGEIGGGSFHVLKGVGTHIRAYLNKKYAGKKLYVLNDKYAS
jgi:hypothetical protein